MASLTPINRLGGWNYLQGVGGDRERERDRNDFVHISLLSLFKFLFKNTGMWFLCMTCYETRTVHKMLISLSLSVTGLLWFSVYFSAEGCIHQLWPLRTLRWFKSPFTPWFLPWRTLRWDPFCSCLLTNCRSYKVISCANLVYLFIFSPL